MAFSHIDESGRIQMVDISQKKKILRTAVASGEIVLQELTVKMLREKLIKKGDAIACAKIAGIMAAKKTSELIPLCHPLLLNDISLDFTIHEESVEITATVVCEGKTGVEMEALCAVSVAALTLYDMCKAVDKNMVIQNIKLIEKKKVHI